MRAMVVSFAVYNLWIDWKTLAPYLAQLFLGNSDGDRLYKAFIFVETMSLGFIIHSFKCRQGPLASMQM